MADYELKGKTILITGGSSGIGRATALACAEQGAKVVILGTDQKRLDQVFEALQGSGHLKVNYDLLAHTDYSDLFSDIIDRVGKLNGMVHSAGMAGYIPLRAITWEKMDQIMSLNFFAFVELVKQYAKKKYSDGGSIVGVSSFVTERGEVPMITYSASKGAMDAAVRCMAVELIPKGIRVNTVKPGMIETEMLTRELERGIDQKVATGASAMGTGEPEDVANAIMFLLSDLSKHTSGREVFVDGCGFL